MTSTKEQEHILQGYANYVLDFCKKDGFRIFDGFIPMIPELYRTDDFDIWQDATTDCMDGEIRMSALYLGIGEADGRNPQKDTKIYSLRKIKPKELRKRTGVFIPRASYRFSVGYETKKQIYDCFLQSGKDHTLQWLEIPNYETPPAYKKYVLFHAQTLLGLQFLLENQPFVYIREDDSKIGFSLPLDDLSDLKSLFSLRDIPDGYKRRPMLRNWVAEHLRSKPRKPDEKVLVKTHLRGKEEFKWNGLSGYITTH